MSGQTKDCRRRRQRNGRRCSQYPNYVVIVVFYDAFLNEVTPTLSPIPWTFDTRQRF